jgi:hypothetical protein
MAERFGIAVNISDPAADNKQIFLYKAPSAANGGGVRILSASAEVITSQAAATSFSLALHKYSSAGTPAVNGTIAAAIGGTAATYWTAGVPQSFSIDTTYAFLDAGEWLVIDYQEDGTVTPTGGINFTANLQFGN